MMRAEATAVLVPATEGPFSGDAEQGVTQLTAAMERELSLLDEFSAVLRRQREAVAAENVTVVEETVTAAHRILLTMGEARNRRRALLRLHAEGVALEHLESAFWPASLPGRLARARDTLRARAGQLQEEVALNRRILDGALRSGDDQLRTITGESAHALVYGSGGASPAAARHGMLLNQRA